MIKAKGRWHAEDNDTLLRKLQALTPQLSYSQAANIAERLVPLYCASSSQDL